MLPVDDEPSEDIVAHFDAAHEFILGRKHQNRNVLVHCISGISRGPSIVMSYLIKFHGKTYREAYEFTKSRRNVVHPNSGFQKQLKAYSEQFHGK